jgi:hypothetical protein
MTTQNSDLSVPLHQKTQRHNPEDSPSLNSFLTVNKLGETISLGNLKSEWQIIKL